MTALRCTQTGARACKLYRAKGYDSSKHELLKKSETPC